VLQRHYVIDKINQIILRRFGQAFEPLAGSYTREQKAILKEFKQDIEELSELVCHVSLIYRYHTCDLCYANFKLLKGPNKLKPRNSRFAARRYSDELPQDLHDIKKFEF
jgi:hypothetical protein